MSGICGIIFNDRSERVSRNHLLTMIHALSFSGENGGFTANHKSASIGAQRFPGRLSGVAEMSAHEEPLLIAFCGSLYNLKELFPSNGQNPDPFERLLELFLEKGTKFLQLLRGEFVLAVWDGREESLYLAVDRFRVHPLFYYCDREQFIFASRIKAIVACPTVRLTINPEAIIDVVASSIIPTPKTIFKEIKKLPGGHFLTYRRGETHLEPYWKTDFLNPSTERETILIQDLKKHFTDAVSVCLDVDKDSSHIGTFLSGGVDSSTLTGVLTKLVKHPVKSFSIGFDEERFNEINYARIAARAFGAEHYEYFVTPADTCDAIPILLSAIDEPYANASAIPAYFCAKMAKEHGVDVLYAGDGGDELFAGNERYATQRLFAYYQRIPPAVRNVLVEPLVLSLADSLKLNFLIKGGRYIHRANLPYYERISSYDFFNVVPLTEFIGENLLVDISRDYNPYEIVDDYYHQAPANNNLDRHLFIDWKLTLTDNDLIKVTRMTEAAEVTVRFPFLDSKLVEFSTKVPAYIKMRGRKLRSFFKNAYSDLLPLEIRKKKKHGFGLPIPIWLRTDKRLNEMMYDLVLSPKSVQRGYFKKKALEQLIEAHKTDGTSFHGTVLWNLMVLELWHRNYRDKVQ